jgi:hypothetical protein
MPTWWFEAFNLDDPTAPSRYIRIYSGDYGEGLMETTAQAERVAAAYAADLGGSFTAVILGRNGLPDAEASWNQLITNLGGRSPSGREMPVSEDPNQAITRGDNFDTLSDGQARNLTDILRTGGLLTQEQLRDRSVPGYDPRALAAGGAGDIPWALGQGAYAAQVAPRAEFEYGRKQAGQPVGFGTGVAGRYGAEQYGPFYRAFLAGEGLRESGMMGGQPQTFTEYAKTTRPGDMPSESRELLQRYAQLGQQFPEGGEAAAGFTARRFGRPETESEILDLFDIFRTSKISQIGGTAGQWLPSATDAMNAFMAQPESNRPDRQPTKLDAFNFGKSFFQAGYIDEQGPVRYQQQIIPG